MILDVKHGGLGDHLAFSTLPEIAHAQGYEVWLSNSSEFRNSEIKEVVWQKNPFFKGFCDQLPNAGHQAISLLEGSYRYFDREFIERIEEAHNLRSQNCYPKTYLQHADVTDFNSRTIVDIGSTTHEFSQSTLADFLHWSQHHFDINLNEALIPHFKMQVAKNNPNSNFGIPVLVESLAHYATLLANCHTLVCVHSGAHALAASLHHQGRMPRIICLTRAWNYNSRTFVFPNVFYHIAV